nr:MAG TPA: ZntB-like protein [Caudoviricetes sp.]
MEGLNTLLNELAKMLGVGTDALKGTLDSIGTNYKEIYSTLLREYTIKQVMDNLSLISVVGLFLLCIISGIYIMAIEELKLPWFLIVGLTLCILVLLLTMISPIFYPNINLIESLINR